MAKQKALLRKIKESGAESYEELSAELKQEITDIRVPAEIVLRGLANIKAYLDDF